ncbi:MAG: LysE family transporter [Pseudazoarcus pumilus]|nr:LysE family transporter [Pseudazoarcus pumilus]
MTTPALVALFVTLFVLAIVPSTSVLTVVARAASGGTAHGALAALGVVTGDVLYICLALFGLSALMAVSGPWLDYLPLLAAAVLGWLAWSLWQVGAARVAKPAGGGRASFAAGLAVTLVDYKAIGFYLLLLPGFVDLSALSVSDALRVLLIAVVAVFAAKFAYVLALHQVTGWLGDGRARNLNRLAALVLAVVALLVLLRMAG